MTPKRANDSVVKTAASSVASAVNEPSGAIPAAKLLERGDARRDRGVTVAIWSCGAEYEDPQPPRCCARHFPTPTGRILPFFLSKMTSFGYHFGVLVEMLRVSRQEKL